MVKGDTQVNVKDMSLPIPKNGKPMTEKEYIQTCTTEQLAEVLNKIFMTRTFCHICPEGGVCDIGYECKYHGAYNVTDVVQAR
jgi:hypothetical protein